MSGTQREPPAGVLSVVQCQASDGRASLLFSRWYWRVGRERLWWWLHPLLATQQYRLASMAAWLSSTGISHYDLLPHIPSTCLCSQQQPSPPNCSTIPKLQLPAPADQCSCPGCMAAARTVWFSFHLGCHRSALSLSTLNVSPLTQTTALKWGLDPCFSVRPPAKGRASPTNTPVFTPSSFILWSFAWFYILFHWSGIPVHS